jgi:hypothetical protein
MGQDVPLLDLACIRSPRALESVVVLESQLGCRHLRNKIIVVTSLSLIGTES